MIIERVEKNDLIRALYESSNIVASSYDKKNKTLGVIFKNGGHYEYLNVPETDYLRFEIAESQGKVLNETIKKHSFLKRGDVNADDFIKDIKKIKSEEIKAMEIGIIDLMKENLSYNDGVNMLSKELIFKLGNMINKYKEMIKII